MVDNGAGGDYLVRQQIACLHEFVWFHQGDIGGEGNKRVEIAGAELVGQVAERVGTVRADECQVGAQWSLQQPGFAVERQGLFAIFHNGADAGRGQETAEPSAAAADLFNQRTLRHQLNVHLFGNHPTPGFRVGADMGRNDFVHPAIDDQWANTGIDKGGIVGDQCQVSDAGFKQGFDKAGRGSNPHKTANHDGHAVTKEPGSVL